MGEEGPARRQLQFPSSALNYNAGKREGNKQTKEMLLRKRGKVLKYDGVGCAVGILARL